MQEEELTNAIRLARQRDERGFDALVEGYSARLYGYLYRLVGSRELADDLLQEVFVRVVRRVGDYHHDGRFEAWLFRIASNVARDQVRRARRRGRVTFASGPVADEEAASSHEDREARSDARPERRMELAEQVDRLQGALTELSPAEREVIMLRHFSDLSFKEIAETMGTPVGTALARAHRGLKRLRELMEADNGR